MLQGLDGASALAEHLGDLLHGEVGNDSQGEHVTLVGREQRKDIDQVAVLDDPERVGLGVPARGLLGDGFGELHSR